MEIGTHELFQGRSSHLQGKEESPYHKSKFLVSISWISSLQNWERIKVCYLRHSEYPLFLCGRLSWLILTHTQSIGKWYHIGFTLHSDIKIQDSLLLMWPPTTFYLSTLPRIDSHFASIRPLYKQYFDQYFCTCLRKFGGGVSIQGTGNLVHS